MKIDVCVGSSCHLKGSYRIIELLKEHLEDNNLSEAVELKAAFCLGRCTNGVTVRIDDEIICGVCAENFQQFFDTHVLRKENENAAAAAENEQQEKP